MAKPKERLPRYFQRRDDGSLRIRVQVPERHRRGVGKLNLYYHFDPPCVSITQAMRIERDSAIVKQLFDYMERAVPPHMVMVGRTQTTLLLPGGSQEVQGRYVERGGHRMIIRELPLIEAEALKPRLPSQYVIEQWRRDREILPKPKAIRHKMTVMRNLFAFLGRADNLLGVTEAELQAYKEHLQKARPGIARDHLAHIKAIYTVADNNNKLPKGVDNPARKLNLPGKRQKTKRLPWSDGEATLLLDMCANQEPIVRWGHRFGAMGLITSEFAEANVRDVVTIKGVLSIHIRPDNRLVETEDGDQENALKTAARTRMLPIPTVWASEFRAFTDQVVQRYGPDAPLFSYLQTDQDGLRSNEASERIMKSIRRVDIKGRAKVFYCWRHRVASLLENSTGVSADRQRYILGHAARDEEARTYLQHLPGKLLPVMNRLLTDGLDEEAV